MDEILEHRKNIRQRVQNYAAKLAKSGAKTPKILSFFGRAKGYQANGDGTYQHYMIKLIGAQNAVNFKGSKILSVEQIIASKPDIIILTLCYSFKWSFEIARERD